MATTTPPTVLSVDGDYEFRTLCGREHLLTLKGTWDSATITMTAYNDATGTFTSVSSGSWTADAEISFNAQSDQIRLTVSNDGASTAVAVTLVPLRKI